MAGRFRALEYVNGGIALFASGIMGYSVASGGNVIATILAGAAVGLATSMTGLTAYAKMENKKLEATFRRSVQKAAATDSEEININDGSF